MRGKFSIINIVVVTLILIVVTASVYAQDAQELINQLCGRGEAPRRNAQQLAQAYQQAIDYLLPLMSAENVRSRYDHQITFQAIGSHASRPGAELERETLAKVIINNLEQAEMPDTVRHWFVLQLERIGKGESVSALAKMMKADDKNLRDCARRALEKNTDPGATDVLLEELSSAKDADWKIGLISTIGMRDQGRAVTQIAKMLDDKNPKVATAAVVALSTIGDEDSTKALFRILEKPTNPLYMKAAQGLIDIAKGVAEKNKNADAAKIYQALYENATQVARRSRGLNPFSIRAAAINGLVVCDPEKGAQEVANMILDEDAKIRDFVVHAARLAPSLAPTQLMSQMLPKLEPYYQIQVLGLVADRGEISSVKFVEAVLNSKDESVRLTAIETLAKIGNDEVAETLFKIAAMDRGTMREAACDGLAVMVGSGIEDVIKNKAASGDVKTRVVAIGLLGQRRMFGATESLLKYAAEDDSDISIASFEAMVNVVDSGDITTMVDLIAVKKSDSTRDRCVTAFKSVLARIKDKDAAARVIIGKMETLNSDVRLSLLVSLSALGGSTALEVVTKAAQSTDQTEREAGIRTLSDWPDFEGAKVLLEIASKSETSLTHYVLAMRGAVRLIRVNTSASIDERRELCFRAFDIALRDEEKRLIISAMGFLPDMKVADRLIKLTEDEKFKAEAGLAAVELAINMLRIDFRASRDLARKIRDMDISDEVNARADRIIRGRGMRFRR